MKYLNNSNLILGEENKHILQQLEWFLTESDKGGVLFPSLLFVGQKGIGKTKLMNLVGKRVASIKNSVFITKTPESMRDESDVHKAIVQAVKVGEGVIAVDEIHNLRPRASDELGVFMSLTETHEYKFSVLGATTEPHKVKKPLESRMIKLMISNYSSGTLAMIAKSQFHQLTDDAADMISKITDGSPRYILQQLVRPLKAFSFSKGIEKVDTKAVKEWMRIRGMDKYGLTQEQRMYLRVFGEGIILSMDKSFSLETISRKLDQSTNLTKDDIEKRLVQIGFVEVGKGGRKLTDAGYEYLKEIVEKEIL